MAQGQEKEIKLLSTKAGRRKFFQLALVKEKVIPGSRHTLDLWNQYRDTRDGKLTRTGMAYRIRRTNGKAFEATVKSQGKTVNGFSSREEYTVPLEKPEPVIQGFAPQLDQKLQTLLQEDELLPLCTVEFTRKTALLQLSAVTVVEAALDQGTLTAGDKTEPIEELELEIKRGQERDLLRFTAALAREIPLWPEERSKFKRGLDLLGWKGTPSKAAKGPEWNRETEPSEVWQALVRQTLSQGLDLLVPDADREFQDRSFLELLQQCAGLWDLGEGFLSQTSWKKDGICWTGCSRCWNRWTIWRCLTGRRETLSGRVAVPGTGLAMAGRPVGGGGPGMGVLVRPGCGRGSVAAAVPGFPGPERWGELHPGNVPPEALEPLAAGLAAAGRRRKPGSLGTEGKDGRTGGASGPGAEPGRKAPGEAWTGL